MFQAPAFPAGAFFMEKSMITGTKNLEVLWGAKAIGNFIGKSDRGAFHLLESGVIPGRKIGSQWVASKGELAAALGLVPSEKTSNASSKEEDV
jgi:hypothetical protein